MAEPLVSAILQQLVKVIDENVVQELKLVRGVGKEVRMLQSNFEAIQCVLGDAEEKQFREKRVRHWLARLKEVAYDMDNVLDEWRTAILKLEIDGVESIHVRKKVCSFLLCFASCRQVVRHHEIATRIKEINEEVDVIAKQKDMYHLAISEIKQLRRLESSSFADISKLHGRDDVKNKIVSTLLGGNGIQIISILGMGGLGKTALAQMIFNDGQVRAHFNKVVWVCVSDFFDQNKIVREILGGFDQDSVNNLQNSISLEVVLAKICEKIRRAKFLLVLDDVWTDRDEDWEPLRVAFQRGMPGSRILVTTRKESVATGMGSSQVFPLKALSDEVCWLIINQLAFIGKGIDSRKNLEGIGKEIAKKCKGLPLAAKSLGCLLRDKKTRNEWQNILNSELWELDIAKEYIFKPLLLSYYDLPLQIRSCLLYCAIFPKDFEFLPPQLIEHWMAHGYLNSYENSGKEEEKGMEYFNYLASRSFFQDFKKNLDGTIYECKMHDMVHDFIQYLTNEEIVAVDAGSNDNRRLNLSSKRVHHLRVINANGDQISMFENGIEKLRSFVISFDTECKENEVLKALFKGAKHLRLLGFGLYTFMFGYQAKVKEIPKEIKNLIHLRYLNLRATVNLKELPEELCELFNLQYLNLFGCKDLEKLPDGIGKLINLRYLYTFSCKKLKYYPKGIGRLTSLRELYPVKARVDGNDVKEFSFGDLEKLDNLRGHLALKLVGNVVDVEEAERAKLHKKINLRQLHIDRGDCGSEDCDSFIQALNPLPSLRITRTDVL